MLILEHGEKRHAYKYFICSRCGTRFIADQDEYLIDKNTNNYITNCPDCNDYVYAERNVPIKEFNCLRSQYEQKG